MRIELIAVFALIAVVVGVPLLGAVTVCWAMTWWAEHRFRVRFRNILMITTIVAVVLGLSVYTLRK